MKTIWKYPLRLVRLQKLKLPQASQLLNIQLQLDVPVLWAMVDTESAQEEITIYLVMTGVDLTIYSLLTAAHGSEPNWRYINTVQLRDGIVLHFFSSTTGEAAEAKKE